MGNGGVGESLLALDLLSKNHFVVHRNYAGHWIPLISLSFTGLSPSSGHRSSPLASFPDIDADVDADNNQQRPDDGDSRRSSESTVAGGTAAEILAAGHQQQQHKNQQQQQQRRSVDIKLFPPSSSGGSRKFHPTFPS
jgi:hypothetical protein